MINKKIEKTTFDTTSTQKVINRAFSTFTPEQPVQGPDIEGFFELYNQLYYLIPIEGETNSHQFIVRESSKLALLDEQTSQVQELTDQIQELLEENLELRQQVLDLEVNKAQQ